MYTLRNFKTKKLLKEAVTASLTTIHDADGDRQAGRDVTLYNPGLGPDGSADGEYSVEGPHYPKPHTWYARVRVQGGRVVKVIS